jgi:hypothetical protein
MSKRRIILIICAIPVGLLGAGLTLGGCSLGGWWLVVLGQGRSAATLPDPITILYPIIMIAVGVVLLSITGVCLVLYRRLQHPE